MHIPVYWWTPLGLPPLHPVPLRWLSCLFSIYTVVLKALLLLLLLLLTPSPFVSNLLPSDLFKISSEPP